MLSTLYTRQRAANVLVYLKKKGKTETRQEKFALTKLTILLSQSSYARESGSRAFRDEELTSSHWLIGPRSRGGPFRHLENRKPSSLIPRYCTDLALEASTLTISLTGPWLNPFSSKSIDTHNPPRCSLNVLASPLFVKVLSQPEPRHSDI